MIYKVRRQGVRLGEHTLDELIRRRGTGEFSGGEYVQQEGARDWQPLDLVLEGGYRTGLTPPPPSADGPVGLGNLFWVALVALVVVAGGLGFFFARLAVRTPLAILPASAGTGRGGEAAVPAAKRPLVWTPQSGMAGQSNTRDREFRRRQWVEGYEQRGDHEPECDEAARIYLRSWLALSYGGPGATNRAWMAAENLRLAADPHCTDPLLLTIVGIESVNAFQARDCFRRALAGFPKSDHRAYPWMYACVMLANSPGLRLGEREDLAEAARRQWTDMFHDGSVTPADQEELAEIMILGWGIPLAQHDPYGFQHAVVAAGEDYRWLALCLDGEAEVERAWAVRGSGYADSVTTEGWSGFNAHLARARSDYTAAWKLHPDWPLAPERMIYVALGDSDIDEMRSWFDRTTRAQLDFEQAYRDFRWGLRSRWYGNPASLLAFGEAGLNTGRFDTDVPHKYVNAVLNAEQELGVPAGHHIFGRADVWPHLRRMYEGYLAATPPGGARDTWRSDYAVAAYFAGQYGIARAQLGVLNWQLAPASLRGWNTDLTEMPLEVAARSSSLAGGLDQARQQVEVGDWAAALARYQQLEPASPDARTRQYLELQARKCSLALKLSQGGWVDWLPTATNDPIWTFELGAARVRADGSVEVESAESGHLLYSHLRVGDAFEVRGTVELVRSANTNFQMGIVLGQMGHGLYNWYGFRLKRHLPEEGDVVAFARDWESHQLVQPLALNNGTNSFRLTYQAGKVTAVVNGVRVFDAVPVPVAIEVPDNNYQVGLGAFSDSPDSVVRYRDVQLRRL